ncbi:MAG: DUF3604 domain-containing protein [Deltaproteobacteria bacterium]|nr:DUF3604 domain-containing protein [Deltaproteobacteria bacterium]
MQHIETGSASIEPYGPVVAGSFQCIIFTYTAGHPVDDTGYLKVVFRHVGDFGTPQFDSPTAANYCTVTTTGDCHIEPRWDPKGHTRPWGQSLFLKVMKCFLKEGEKIIITFGDRSAGSPGWQMQTFCEYSFEFKTLVDPIATYEFKEIMKSPTLSVIPGQPSRAVCIAPSQIVANKDFYYYLKLEDQWGNPTDKPLKIRHIGFSQIGINSVTISDEKTNLLAESNPIETLEEEELLHPYWADFHGQSEETVGSNSIQDYFAFAHDYALIDIAGHQGNDFQISDDFWETINETTRKFYQPDSFVTFPGYEWSGNTPLGGDRNVFFRSEGGQISRSCTDLLQEKHSAYANSPTVLELFEKLRGQMAGAFAFAHVGGRYADITMHDPEIELAVEIHSDWGTFEWLLEDALKLGYRIGICANSDGHKGRPGASYPGASKFGSLGGLTCVLAAKLERESIFDALKARHCYATTGNRSLVKVYVTMDNGQRAMMGDIVSYEYGTALLSVNITGTAPIESVEIRNGLDTVGTFRPYDKNDIYHSKRLKIVWSGSELRGRARMVSWDGVLQLIGNTISSAKAINLWNEHHPLKLIDENRLEWESITTGGVAGIILTLKEANTGQIEIETAQGNISIDVNSIGISPKTWNYGGLDKNLKIYRLPDNKSSTEVSFKLAINKLRKGDNPIYVRMMQEDGHMAWSSPVYLINNTGKI